MSVSFTQQYTSASTGKLTTASVTVDVKACRRDSSSSLAEPQFVLSVITSGKDEWLQDITDIVRCGLDGKKSTFSAELDAETFLNGATIAGASVVPFNSVTNFAVGDPICVKSKHGATDRDYAIITAINTTTKNVTLSTDGSGTGLANAYPKGAVVQSLATRDVTGPDGISQSRGAKAQLEAISDPAVTVADGTGNSVDVNVTLVADAAVVSFDVYATRDPLVPGTVIPLHLEPVYQDAREATGRVNITTYMEDDNKSYSLVSAKKFYFHVVAKDAKGHPRTADINMSKPITKSHTLD